MEQTRFEEAQRAYDAGDFRTAAKLLLASAGKGAAGNGRAYHMAGNSLLRIRRYQDAVTVYGHALRDETYDRRGAVRANLGAAYCALGEYVDAVNAYEAALDEPGYDTPYRALQGLAGALCERGRIDDAAVAYRRAAIDPENPDPGKALVNLGLCFMAMNRPSDSVEAYKAALGFDEYTGRGKALANLGQAYVALGQFNEAVKAFERASELHGHVLSPAAQADYERAQAQAQPVAQTVEGWETGELVASGLTEQPTGWDTADLRALTGSPRSAARDSSVSGGSDDTMSVDSNLASASTADVEDGAALAASALGMGDEEAVSSFFSMTEEEMRTRDKEVRRVERAERRASGGWARSVLVSVILVAVIAGSIAAAYWGGYGWPTQSTTVTGLIDAYAAGQSVDGYWVAVPDKDVAKEMAKMPPVKEFSIERVDRGRTSSSVKVTVTPQTGAPLHYEVRLGREGFGWKVTGIENDWRSSGS